MSNGWNLKKAIISIIKLTFSLPFILLIRIISPFVLIRFGYFYSARIGHFSQNIDIYLTEREMGFHPPHAIDFFFHQYGISNYQLKKMWERTGKVRFLPETKIFACLVWANSLFPGRGNHTVKIPLIDSHGIVPDWPSHIYFTQQEEEYGMRKLREMGIPINAPFVCFHNRDSAYEKRFVRKEEDSNFHDYRDSNIDNYILAITRLTEMGYYAFRMGVVVNERLNSINPCIIDYATDYRSDFMDIYLSSKCKFFIASGTGIIGLPILFRNNMVLVNYIPFQLINIPAWPRNSLLILKKLWLKTEKRFLTFKEMSGIEVDIHYKGNYYESINIEPIENTSDEILDIVMEMDGRLNGTWQIQKEDEELQDIFWSFFPSIAKKSRKKDKYSFGIGAEFLRKNKDLLKC